MSLGAEDGVLEQRLGLRVVEQGHGGSPRMYRRQPTWCRSCRLSQSRTVKLVGREYAEFVERRVRTSMKRIRSANDGEVALDYIARSGQLESGACARSATPKFGRSCPFRGAFCRTFLADCPVRRSAPVAQLPLPTTAPSGSRFLRWIPKFALWPWPWLRSWCWHGRACRKSGPRMFVERRVPAATGCYAYPLDKLGGYRPGPRSRRLPPSAEPTDWPGRCGTIPRPCDEEPVRKMILVACAVASSRSEGVLVAFRCTRE